nr:uncharacterized protein LOC122271424 [Parasteatoda tepidariorum]
MKLSERLIVIPALVVVALFIIVLYRSESNYIELKSKLEESNIDVKLPKKFQRSEKTEKDAEFEPMPKSLAKVIVTEKTTLSTTTKTTTITTTRAPRVNKFEDMDKYTTNNPRYRSYMEWPPFVTLPPDNPRLADIMGLEIRPELPSWERFNLQISKQYVYEENSTIIDDLERDLATQRIVAVGKTYLLILINFTVLYLFVAYVICLKINFSSRFPY